MIQRKREKNIYIVKEKNSLVISKAVYTLFWSDLKFE